MVALTCDLACVSAPAECPCQRRQQVGFLGAPPVGSYGGHTWVIVLPPVQGSVVLVARLTEVAEVGEEEELVGFKPP